METLTAVLALFSGLLVRLALPAAATLTAVYFLSKLDARWQAEAALEAQGVVVAKSECWKITNCAAGPTCPLAASPDPCWQVRRLPNGYLREECLGCQVFLNAPLPRMRVTA